MIRVAVTGDIGSGKSYIAKSFGFPVFNADDEVSKLYKSDKKIFNKLKKSQFVLNNNFTNNALKKDIKLILNKIN
jgi:dephospho-CoA kinase